MWQISRILGVRVVVGGEVSFGRVVVKESERAYGYGHVLIEETLKAIATFSTQKPIKISAQTYLKKFYESHGFYCEGEEYLEDGIPHIAMLRD